MRDRSLLAGPRWLAVFLTVVLWIACLPRTASATEVTTVSVSAPTGPLEAGQQFTASIDVEPCAPISGMQFDLSFDPSLVAVSVVQKGGLLDEEEATSFFNPGSVDNQAGKVTGVFGAITTPGMSVSGPGTFATVIFTARQRSESCPLTLSKVIVGDIDGNAVPVSLEAGSSPNATAERPVFRWWVLSVIVGAAVMLIAVTVTAILLRRRQMLRDLESSRSPNQRTSTGVK